MNAAPSAAERSRQWHCIACGLTTKTTLTGVPDVEREPNDVVPSRFDIYRCTGCGLGELKQKLDERQLEYIYPQTYYSYAAPSRSPLRRVFGWLERVRYQRYRRVPPFTSLLEIGCGSGEFLERIKDRGRVVGLERSAQAREIALRRNVDVRVGDIETPTLFEHGEFDCVYINHALEHLSDPARVLSAAKRFLKPGGVLYVGVPNLAGISARMTGKFWYGLAAPEHITHWTPRSMRSFLTGLGFDVERITFHSDPISLPLSIFYALGGRRTSLVGANPAKLMIFAFAYVLLPITRIVDFLGGGDLMEVAARLQ